MFTGRLGRLGYILGNLYFFVPLIAVILLYAITSFIFGTVAVEPTASAAIADDSLFEGDGYAQSSPVRSILNAILFLFGAAWIIMLVPVSIGLMVRRWHDMNQTGWLALLGFVPFVSLVVFIVQLFVPGTDGPNNFGDKNSHLGFIPVLFGSKQPVRTSPPAEQSQPVSNNQSNIQE